MQHAVHALFFVLVVNIKSYQTATFSSLNLREFDIDSLWKMIKIYVKYRVGTLTTTSSQELQQTSIVTFISSYLKQFSRVVGQ